MHTTCVYGLALWFCLSWTMYDQATTAATSSFDPLMLPVRTIRYAKVNKCSPNFTTHIYLHVKTICSYKIHAFLVYVVSSSLGVFYIGTSIGLFELSMVLRLK